MKQTHTLLGLLVVLLALPMAAVGQDEKVSTEAASDDEVIENIVVAGQRSEAELRRDLWRVEDDFYSLYSKLNDDNLYDVRCTTEAPTGSRIKTQVCRPEFLSRAISRGQINRMTNLDTSPVIAAKMTKFRQTLNTSIAANPELQAAAVTYNTARTRFIAQSEKSTNK